MKLFLLLALALARPAGTYTNPILFSDYSDPDVIRVGEDYWMTASSFTCYPGLQILHSTDLVNWEIVNAALPRLEPSEEFDSPSHGNGVWAPSIREHGGRFWIFWGDPDYGIYQINTEDPRGEWSEPHLVLAGKGLIDPCPLWDDDGRVYLVHGWAGSRAGFKSILSACEMDALCTRVTSSQVLVFDGKATGNDTVEGPKFYKKDGWYYIFAPAGGVKEGWQLVLRSRNPYGPYEWRNVMHQGGTGIHGPHQGGWVTDTASDSWFLHFEDRYAWGRVCHLQPMAWTEDGWCTIGLDSNADGIGEPVGSYRLPAGKPTMPEKGSVSAVCTEADFSGTEIPLNWQWEANPQFSWYQTCPAEGFLRLNCILNPEGWRNLRDTPNILAQKVVGPEMGFTTRLDFRPAYEGERAGVIVTGLDYSTLELYYDGSEVLLRRVLCEGAEDGGEESVLWSVPAERKDGICSVWIRAQVKGGCECTLRYSTDGKKFKAAGPAFTASAGRWIGAKIGYFATSRIRKNDGGYVHILPPSSL